MATPLNAAEAGFVRRGEELPLIALLDALVRWIDDRLRALMAAEGFDDLRPAHNAVIVNLPSSGMRLTDLAQVAGISKQAMAELVDDLVAKRYLKRSPDPSDGRAKLIVYDTRGEETHPLAVRFFAQIERELAEIVGVDDFAQARGTLTTLFFSTVASGAKPSA